MSEFKGTKGEWIVKDRSSKLESTIYSENKRICDVKSYGNDFESFDNNGNKYSEPSYKERLYNEKLIACAPEMLSKLKETLEVIKWYMNNTHPDDNQHSDFFNIGMNDIAEIEELIKKACGNEL